MKAKRGFPLFDSHLDLAHFWWERCASQPGWAIDATCGNGHDTFFLAQHYTGVIALDVQKAALEKTKERLEHSEKVHFFLQSHESFPPLASQEPIRLIVYNLGYLPGGDKSLTTRVASTLKSVDAALHLLVSRGLISITLYPGHEEGKREKDALLSLISSLDPAVWSVSLHEWRNRKSSPALVLIQKCI